MLSQLINTTKHDNVRIDALRLDGGTQPRHGINTAYVAELAESIVEGVTLPPVDVIYDGTNYWLYDGFHRVAAHQAAGILIVDANIHQGTQADAQWRSYAANQTHGLRRTNEDKERAIKAALRHPNGITLANREIARHLGVDHKTVGSWREKMEATGEIPQSTTRTGADGRAIDTTNIGTNQPPVKATETDEERRQRIRDNDRRMKDEINSRFASQTPARPQPAFANPSPTQLIENSIDTLAWEARPASPQARIDHMMDPTNFAYYHTNVEKRTGLQVSGTAITDAMMAVIADTRERNELDATPPAISNQDRPLPDWATDELEEIEPSTPSTPATPEANAIRLTGFALRQRLVDRTITDAYNLPGSVSLVLDNGQTITINGTGLYFTVKEA